MNPARPTLSAGLLRALLYGALGLLALLTLLPFIWMACASVKTEAGFFTSQFLPPGDGFLGIAWDQLTVASYQRLFTVLPFGRALLNSCFLASVISLLATFSCAAGGYALAKFRFRGRVAVTTAILGTVVLPASLLLGP